MALLTELRQRPTATAIRDLTVYQGKPVEYAHSVLKVNLTPHQEEGLRLLHVPPNRVMMPAANNVGKTFEAAVALCYWYDVFPDGVVYSVAPTYDHVCKVLWGQVRLLRYAAGLESAFTGPKAPEMYTAPNHFALGLTASRGEGFQGRHIGRKLFLFDEACALQPFYWMTLRTMFDAANGDAVLVIFNPTDTTSFVYLEDMAAQEEEKLTWHRMRLNALEHPNIAAGLRGDKILPFPDAIKVEKIEEYVRDLTEPVSAGDERATDVFWPPEGFEGGRHYRPGAEFEARVLGLWPSSGSGIWSDRLWAACLDRSCPTFPDMALPQIGCDCAQGKGDDYHAIHGRWGDVSVHHETANTMDPKRIFLRLKEAAWMLARLVNAARPRMVPTRGEQIGIRIDDDGTGGAIASFLRADGYTVFQVGAGCRATKEDKYPRRRDELWFEVADRADLGKIYLGKLPKEHLRRLRAQLMAVECHLDPAGRRCVEPKDDTKEKIGRSPDDADAFNLAFLEGAEFHAAEPIRVEAAPRRSLAERRGLFGRRSYT